MGRRLLAIAAVVAVGVVVVGAWAFWPRGATEVSSQDALADFRDRATSTTDDAVDADAPPRAVPVSGVYSYRAKGREEVKLGPLPSQDRPLPDTVTAVVVGAGDGCFELTLNLFAEHTEQTRYCVADDGTVTLDEHVKHQRIGAVSPTATMGCDPSALVRPGADSTRVECDLEMTGGPLTLDATLTGTATTGEGEPRTVGSEEVTARPLTVSYEVSGDLAGTWTETLWLATDSLPVRIERSLELSGPATFSERSTLDLVSLEPTT